MDDTNQNTVTAETIEAADSAVIETVIERVLAKAVNAAVEKMVDSFNEIRCAKAEQVISPKGGLCPSDGRIMTSPNEPKIPLNGAVSGETGRETPDRRVDFAKLSYSELCAFLEKHPSAMI